MRANDFIYDNCSLSSKGMIICSFGGSKGLETINMPEITFNTVSTLSGSKHRLVSTVYDDHLETKIQICKNPCYNTDLTITSTEFRNLTSWLNKRRFSKLKFLGDENYIDLYYMASFNIGKIELDGKLIGLELNIITDSPYAYRDEKTLTIKNLVENGKHSINDISYEEGYIYPYTEITVTEDGDLSIYNAIEDRNTYIANCTAGEVIIMDYPIIQSSLSSHNIQNDFNWNFFRVANTFENSRNDLTISIPCTMKVKYSPIVKVGL